MLTRITKYAVMLSLMVAAALPAAAQERACRVLCAPSLLIEPTATIENLAGAPRVSEDGAAPEREGRKGVFEFIVALDVPTKASWLGITLEAIVQPFSTTDVNPFTGQTSSQLGSDIRENPIEIESELNFTWLPSTRTAGWVSSHVDIVDQFSPAKRPHDRSVYTHKLDFELDTAFAVFQRLPERHPLRDVEIEISLDYLASGIPKAGETVGTTRFEDDDSPWSLSFVFVIPIIKGH